MSNPSKSDLTAIYNKITLPMGYESDDDQRSVEAALAKAITALGALHIECEIAAANRLAQVNENQAAAQRKLAYVLRPEDTR